MGGLIEIAAPARLAIAFPSEMERLIMELCRRRWLTRGQLAELLQRNPEGLRARFSLFPWLNTACSTAPYPDKPNRTDQAYTATGDPDETDQ